MLQLLVIYKNYINNKENEREHFAKNKCDVDKEQHVGKEELFK